MTKSFEIQLERTEAAILVEQKKSLVIDTIELPKSLEVGQVLVRVLVSGICGSQLGEILGVKGVDKFLPHLMGHEACGEVLAVGPGVKTVSVNDIVVLHWRKGSGIQSDPPKYKWNGKALNAGWVTTFNRHAIVSENRCTRVPTHVNPDVAALFGCAITTGFGVIENNAGVRMGDTVVVYGAGGIGLNVIQAAALMSASKIIAVDLFSSRLQLAKAMGATHTVNSVEEDAETEIRKALDGDELDVFVDNTGITSVIEMGYRVTHKEGRVVLVGVPANGKNVEIHTLPLHFGKTIRGSHGGESNPEVDIPRYLRLVRNGLVDFDSLITARYKLEDINNAIGAMKDGLTAGRVMIDL